jgi:hypothetical protein
VSPEEYIEQYEDIGLLAMEQIETPQTLYRVCKRLLQLERRIEELERQLPE